MTIVSTIGEEWELKMRRITNDELREILDKHSKWLRDEDGGEQANLIEADLRDTEPLRGNLRYADLTGADLSHADLSCANLGDVNLKGANLKGVNLRHANLSHSDLTDADLRGASLRFADFRYANLSHANLGDAHLRGTDFRFAKLICANLRGADLRNASLIRADLKGARYDDTILEMQCPEEGSFVAWKKLAYGRIAKLLIPEDAKRSSATTRKCRASKAIVLAIYNKNGGEVSEGRSEHDYGFIYWVGETVYPDDWDEERWAECSNGIHFFTTREEAEEY